MDLVTKLQLQAGQLVQGVSVPDTVAPTLPLVQGAGGDDGTALVAFVVDRSELEVYRPRIAAAASRNRLTWVAYPKAGQLGTDLNRDSLAATLIEAGVQPVQPVRQVSVDGVWSALRFRPG